MGNTPVWNSLKAREIKDFIEDTAHTTRYWYILEKSFKVGTSKDRRLYIRSCKKYAAGQNAKDMAELLSKKLDFYFNCNLKSMGDIEKLLDDIIKLEGDSGILSAYNASIIRMDRSFLSVPSVEVTVYSKKGSGASYDSGDVIISDEEYLSGRKKLLDKINELIEDAKKSKEMLETTIKPQMESIKAKTGKFNFRQIKNLKSFTPKTSPKIKGEVAPELAQDFASDKENDNNKNNDNKTHNHKLLKYNDPKIPFISPKMDVSFIKKNRSEPLYRVKMLAQLFLSINRARTGSKANSQFEMYARAVRKAYKEKFLKKIRDSSEDEEKQKEACLEFLNIVEKAGLIFVKKSGALSKFRSLFSKNARVSAVKEINKKCQSDKKLCESDYAGHKADSPNEYPDKLYEKKTK